MRLLPLLCCLAACGDPDGTRSGPVTGIPTGSAPGAPAGVPGSTGLPSAGSPSTGTPTVEGTDFRERGPHETSSADQTVTVATCGMAVTVYTPETPSEGLVVLSHGFQRNKRHVADLADHIASWGLRVVTPNLCHATAFDTDHGANAQDLQALATALSDGEPVVYVGHSAGGLATWLASAADPGAAAHLGLDPVDNQGSGAAIAGTHGIPTYALFGEPAACNSQGNATGWYQEDRIALRLTGADHCDFESPTDALCTTFCGGGSASDDLVRSTVFGSTTAFVTWQLDVDPTGAEWWTPGEAWYQRILTGAVEI